LLFMEIQLVKKTGGLAAFCQAIDPALVAIF
jgi:hypothetical protein